MMIVFSSGTGGTLMLWLMLMDMLISTLGAYVSGTATGADVVTVDATGADVVTVDATGADVVATVSSLTSTVARRLHKSYWTVNSAFSRAAMGI